MFGESVFVKEVDLPNDTEIIFVSDMFIEDYVGGAELTTQALIDSCRFSYRKIRSRDVNANLLQKGRSAHWIFGNFSGINPELLPQITHGLKYSILEYDYKFCKFRSPEKHKVATGLPCDCHENLHSKSIASFFLNSKTIFWMSETQSQIYKSRFPFLDRENDIILGSVFDQDTLNYLSFLREQGKKLPRDPRWIVLGSDSWVKGFENAKTWCEKNHKPHQIVWNVPYRSLLQKMSEAEGFVYLPAGGDTCPRMVIEAKLLGCKLQLNDYVQHKNEKWFSTDDIDSIFNHLEKSPNVFWDRITENMNKRQTISGYITTYNCVSQGYPFEKTIRSLLQFCDEVCVVDGGSRDDTWGKLLNLQSQYPQKIKLKQVIRDWDHPRFAVFDGQQKAEARKMCTGDFCWQMDSDEIVHEKDAKKIIELCNKMPFNIDIISLPVVEYWGGPDKVRCDIQPWKWRLSRNKPNITHGIPKNLRVKDANGDLYALEGTDGCDMIDVITGERLPHATFHTAESEKLRLMAVSGDQNCLNLYENWFNGVIENLPGVYHYSWYDISKKMRLYKGYWTRHWNSLYNKSMEDTADTNMMFDFPWSSVTDEMIEERAAALKNGTGGWIWHSKWSGQRIPHITVRRGEPNV